MGRAADGGSRPSPRATALGHIAIRRRLTRLDLLIIDDFALKSLDALTSNDFYEITVERHARAAATIITSNRGPAEWLTMTTDQLLAQTGVDRLTGHAHTLVLDGPSYRKRQRAV
jgi:DNA replication protein DnaC